MRLVFWGDCLEGEYYIINRKLGGKYIFGFIWKSKFLENSIL